MKAVSQGGLGCTRDLEAGAESWGAPGTWRLGCTQDLEAEVEGWGAPRARRLGWRAGVH